APEDEKDVQKMGLDLHRYQIYREGFIAACPSLTPLEVQLLPQGAKSITLEQGARFLSDYLNGDVYYHTAYPEHNLVRTRTQVKLVSEMEEHWDELWD
ncbi:MAG: mucin desulfatase, partial [Blautia sp.]|nr:mucin desulfatase [Blautia sp.]